MKNLINKVNDYERIIIHRHVFPDGDSLGSQYALKRILESNFNKEVLIVSDDHFGRNESYFKKESVSAEQYEEALVLILDTANSGRIYGDNWSKGKEIYKIDHHMKADIYADNEHIDIESSSTTEILYKWVKENNLFIDSETEYLLMYGLISDTNDMKVSVRENTHVMYEDLIDKVDYKLIKERLFTFNEKETSLYNWVKENINKDNGVHYLMVPADIYKDNGLSFLDFRPYDYINNLLEYCELVCITAFNELENKWYVEFRSKDKRVDLIANKFNGGGHKLRSGCAFTDMNTWDQIVEEIKK